MGYKDSSKTPSLHAQAKKEPIDTMLLIGTATTAAASPARATPRGPKDGVAIALVIGTAAATSMAMGYTEKARNRGWIMFAIDTTADASPAAVYVEKSISGRLI